MTLAKPSHLWYTGIKHLRLEGIMKIKTFSELIDYYNKISLDKFKIPILENKVLVLIYHGKYYAFYGHAMERLIKRFSFHFLDWTLKLISEGDNNIERYLETGESKIFLMESNIRKDEYIARSQSIRMIYERKVFVREIMTIDFDNEELYRKKYSNKFNVLKTIYFDESIKTSKTKRRR